MKKIINAKEARSIALETIQEVASIVKQTLGPGGNPIILQRQGQNPDGTPLKPLITKDGVTVAESIRYSDPAKDSIAQAILQVAQNTVKQAGDGTTTSILLAEAIYEAGFKHLQQGVNGIQLYNDLKKIKDRVINEINETKIDVKDEDVINVARISSNGDEEVANVVYKAISSVGENGHVSLEDGGRETTLELVEGAMYKKGWRSFGPFGFNFVNDKSRNAATLSEPAVLLYAGKLEDRDEFGTFLEKLNEGNNGERVPLVIIAHELGDDLKEFLLELKVKASYPIAAITSPFDGSPNARTEMLEDLAVMLGGKVGAKGILGVNEMTDEHLGCADKIEVLEEEVVIYGGQGEPETILGRLEDLKKFMETRTYEYDRENLRLRIGKLSGGIAVVKVGGDTEIEILEKKDRIEDALCAARVAIEDGIVEGGGSTLLNIARRLPSSSVADQIMKEALAAPVKQIITNVGENPDVILSQLKKGKGYNAKSKVQQVLMENGVIDPAKVTKSALENAVSIAGLLLTTGGAVVVDSSGQPAPNPFAMMGL